MEAGANNSWDECLDECASVTGVDPVDADKDDSEADVDDRHAEPGGTPIDETALRKELQDLVDRTSAGDATAMPALQKALHEHSEYFQGVENLAQLSEAAWLNQIAGTNLFLKATTLKELQSIRSDLLGPNPTRAERLLAERVTTCWLQTQYVDMVVLSNHDSSQQICNELSKRQESAHRRLINSIKQLTQLQKALRPHARQKDSDRPDDPLAVSHGRDKEGSEVLRIAPGTEEVDNGLHVAG
jgi:hypothetical protein